MSLFKKPTVSTAVADLEAALIKLDKAIEHHTAQADNYRTQIADLQVKEVEQAAAANRAIRIKNRLGELLK